ncbi:MAG: 30S ribosomal protein S8 [Ignavibacteria bacterium]|jgi:small subunit ribosomal protein S8|nr:30S ribosomal protein S8 [Ignavibacteria bacterium]MBK7254061.1 30S ribosomal protein S8 [Ignavibacteria bacterium]MBK7446961.1 30S ribosomal protein S8 [Ignavibacteria bacterium]MBK8384043.1 30S ribosomal protein S8 [Ignavibacteria bacterium]MBL0108214.1 30S ribosomal protein S8 [Ignavibacteria bacterium]
MSMTDPIADYLTRVRNSLKAGKKTVDMPYSKFKQAISEILKKSSFIEDFKVIETEGKFKMLSLKLKYNDGESVILGLKRISKPGIRRYVSNEDIPRVRNGLGISIVSTSKGLLTDKEARSLKVGGEVVCEIW